MVRLPRKRSELLKLALTDLEKCELNPRFRVDVCYWLMSGPYSCVVCLAGSVMAQTLNMDDGSTFVTGVHIPNLFSVETRRKLLFLDQVREELVSYSQDPEKFKEQLRKTIIYYLDNPTTDNAKWE